jgi:hypothetical protein
VLLKSCVGQKGSSVLVVIVLELQCLGCKAIRMTVAANCKSLGLCDEYLSRFIPLQEVKGVRSWGSIAARFMKVC